MSKELNIGDYVRTDNGCICKVLEYTDISNNDFYVNTDSPYNVIYKSWIVKSSPSIIDLIEVGDYVNGLLVIAYNEKNKCFICECCGMECGENWIYKNDDIKSIVTKERYESMEYKVNKDE